MDVQTLGTVPAFNTAPDPSSGPASAVPQPSDGISAFPSPDAQQPPASPAQAKGLPSFHLPNDVAKVFAGSSSSNVTVSFKVDHNPNEIVTVFKDSQTGEVITQVPSEIMIKMAEFFDQVAGVVLDKSA